MLVLLVAEHTLAFAPSLLRETSFGYVLLEIEVARESTDVALGHRYPRIGATVRRTVEAVVEDREGFGHEPRQSRMQSGARQSPLRAGRPRS
jgi:hypothetical protein